MIVANTPMIRTTSGAPAAARTAVIEPDERTPGNSHRTGSSQARFGRAILISPRNWIRPAVGS